MFHKLSFGHTEKSDIMSLLPRCPPPLTPTLYNVKASGENLREIALQCDTCWMHGANQCPTSSRKALGKCQWARTLRKSLLESTLCQERATEGCSEKRIQRANNEGKSVLCIFTRTAVGHCSWNENLIWVILERQPWLGQHCGALWGWTEGV